MLLYSDFSLLYVKRALVLLVRKEAGRSSSSLCNSIKSFHASSNPAIKLSRKVSSFILPWAQSTLYGTLLIHAPIWRLFLCLCGAFFTSAHETDFISVLVHILGVCCLVGTLALDPAEAGYIDHILRAAIGDFRLWAWLWFGRISWLRR